MAENEELRVVDNPACRRYELRVGATVVGHIRYDTEGAAVVLIHTDINPVFEGRGYGSRLASGALDDIRARGLSVVPVCRFVRSYIERHPEYADLAARERTAREGGGP
jgi:uncharacterized protein